MWREVFVVHGAVRYNSEIRYDLQYQAVLQYVLLYRFTASLRSTADGADGSAAEQSLTPVL